MTDLEEQFWGDKKENGKLDISERNAKFFLALLFCMAFLIS
mgnify:FL=1